MNIHEHQAKSLLRDYGVNVPDGFPAFSVDEAVAAAEKLAGAVNANFKKITDLLERNYNQALALNFSGTPSFVIGNALYAGVIDRDTLRTAIRSARAA